jgi:hypothetical protein
MRACSLWNRRYFAFSGGLITGIFAPESGGGTFISESREGGGQITPLVFESLSLSGSPVLPDCSSFIGVHDEDGDAFAGGGAFVCATAPLVKRNEQKIAASFFMASCSASAGDTRRYTWINAADAACGWLVGGGRNAVLRAARSGGADTGIARYGAE